jgi:hypothetical protein
LVTGRKGKQVVEMSGLYTGNRFKTLGPTRNHNFRTKTSDCQNNVGKTAERQDVSACVGGILAGGFVF